MDIINAIILGIIQGLTEFLPVSSSGHLEIAQAILGEGKVGEGSMLMTVVLHFATALSTLIIFRKDLVVIFRDLFQFKNNESFQFSLKIVISMIPAALVGIFFNDKIETFFGGALTLVGGMLLVTGILLFLADKAKESSKKVGIKEAILIGISQAIAILPGISRSGATISTAVILGIDKEKAARFSFLMVVPLIFGAMTMETMKYLEIRELEGLDVHHRTEMIVDEIHGIIDIKSINVSFLNEAIIKKETAWSKLKGDSTSQIVKKNFKEDLGKALLNNQQIEKVIKNDLAKVRPHHSTTIISIIIGFIFAFITGLVACKWMIKLVKNSQLKYFAYYCFAIGSIVVTSTLI